VFFYFIYFFGYAIALFIDYRCADGRFLVSPRGMGFPTPDIFPAVKQGLMLA
jgi:hypothetical protein